MTIQNTPPLAPTPTPTPIPIPGDNQAIITGLIDPAKVPATPAGDGGCTPQLCESWTGTTADLASPPVTPVLDEVIAEIAASKGQPYNGVTLDEILGITQPSPLPSLIAGLVIGAVVITAALAALVRHRRVAVTSPSATETEEV